MENRNRSLAAVSAAAADFLESGDAEKALPLYREAVAMATAEGRLEELSGLLGDMAVAYRRLGDLPGAMETNRRAIAAARASGHDLNLARWSGNLGNLLLHHAGDADGAEALFREAVEAAARTGLPDQVSLSASHLAGIMGERGRFSEALEAMAGARAQAVKHPTVAPIIREQEVTLLVRWARSLREQNRVREAREVIDRGLTLAAGTKYEAPLQFLVAEIAEQEGDIVAACAAVERAAMAFDASGEHHRASELRALARRMQG